MIARSSPSASPPQAPLAAITEHGAGRVVVLADSDLFGDDCIGELDHESLWLNLVYWAAQPAFAGVQAVIDSPARSDPSWAELKAAVEELRLTQEPDGSVDPSAHDAGRLTELVETISNAAQRLAPPLPPPGGLHRRPARRPPRLGRLRLRQARLRSLARGVPARARPARRDRAPGRLPDVQAERLARHLLRGADRPRPLARLRRRARALPLRQPEVRPGQLRRLHGRLRLRVRGPLPRDLLHRGAPAEPLRRDLLRPRGGALSPRLRPRPPSSCGSTCRPTPPPA